MGDIREHSLERSFRAILEVTADLPGNPGQSVSLC